MMLTQLHKQVNQLLCHQSNLTFLKFLIIHSEEEGKDISSLSPFLIHKTIMSVAGEPKSIKNLRSGDILIQGTT